jgi:hypothetical protein
LTIEGSDTMTNLLETMKTATAEALRHLLASLTGAFQPGEAHLTGSTAAACVRSSTLDQDLEVLLHEIQRRRGCA